MLYKITKLNYDNKNPEPETSYITSDIKDANTKSYDADYEVEILEDDSNDNESEKISITNSDEVH